jgi:hypothetical protein
MQSTGDANWVSDMLVGDTQRIAVYAEWAGVGHERLDVSHAQAGNAAGHAPY